MGLKRLASSASRFVRWIVVERCGDGVGGFAAMVAEVVVRRLLGKAASFC